MSRPNFIIPENAVYDPQIPSLLDTDDASATDTFNPLFQRLIDNTHAVANQVQLLGEKIKHNPGSIGGINPNMLVNWDFRNLAGTRADQNGNMIGFMGGNEIADNWSASGVMDYHLDEHGMQVVATVNASWWNLSAFWQHLSSSIPVRSWLAGKTLTASAEIEEVNSEQGAAVDITVEYTDESADEYIGNIITKESTSSLSTSTMTIPDTVSGIHIVKVGVRFANPTSPGDSFRVVRIKLELGTESTLHLEPIPDINLQTLLGGMTSLWEQWDRRVGAGRIRTRLIEGSAIANRVLLTRGASSAPVWGQVDLTTDVSGRLPLANMATSVTANRVLRVGTANTDPTFGQVNLGTDVAGAISDVSRYGTLRNFSSLGNLVFGALPGLIIQQDTTHRRDNFPIVILTVRFSFTSLLPARTVLFTLPTELRPAHTRTIWGTASGSTADLLQRRFSIQANGEVVAGNTLEGAVLGNATLRWSVEILNQVYYI